MVALLLLMVATCGQKGPLRLPDDPPPTPASIL
ncbi:MAG: lipoprotein [Proteobacteria bacterium]|nr:lipoprotein [Pseudomonadota bacterium]